MPREFAPEAVAVVLTLLLGVLYLAIRQSVELPAKQLPEELPNSYGQRMDDLTKSIAKASSEVDRLLQEMARVSRERESAISSLEQDLGELSKRAEEAKTRVESLEKVPLPAADHFAKLVEKGERRNARRDYLLFGLGVILSQVVTAILRLIGF